VRVTERLRSGPGALAVLATVFIGSALSRGLDGDVWSDLHGLLTEFRAAGLAVETTVHGDRGYDATETASTHSTSFASDYDGPVVLRVTDDQGRGGVRFTQHARKFAVELAARARQYRARPGRAQRRFRPDFSAPRVRHPGGSGPAVGIAGALRGLAGRLAARGAGSAGSAGSRSAGNYGKGLNLYVPLSGKTLAWTFI